MLGFIQTIMRVNTQRGIAPIAAIIIALLVIGGGGYGVKKVADNKKEKRAKQEQVAQEEKQKEEKAREDAAMLKPTTLQVKLDEQNASGQSGQAIITQIGTSTVKVVVTLTGKPSGVAQPAHIHLGACPAPGAVKYPLTNVDKGVAQTEILNMTIEQLLSELPLAINVHKSAAEAKVYTACGDITDERTGTSNSDSRAMGQFTQTKGGDSEMLKREIKVTYNTQGFSPKTVTIKKGETVVFENKTGKKASVASDEHPTHLLYPEFDQYKTEQRGKGEFRFTFEKAGTWNYHDHLNANMTGTVVVK